MVPFSNLYRGFTYLPIFNIASTRLEAIPKYPEGEATLTYTKTRCNFTRFIGSNLINIDFLLNLTT